MSEATATPPLSTAPADANGPPAEKPKKHRRERSPDLQWRFPTAEAAVAEAKTRQKGQKKGVFTVEQAGKETAHIIAYNAYDAGGWYLVNVAGGKITEIGKPARMPKAPPTADAALAFLNSLPEAERLKVLERLGKK